MKLKKILILTLAGFLAFGATNAPAQKKSAAKKSTSSSTKKTSSSKSSGPTLVRSDLVDNKIIGWIDLENNKDEGLTYFELTLSEHSSSLYMYDNADFSGSWNVSGNKLNIKASQGTISMDMSSKDGGKTFSGTFTNHYVNQTRNMTAYNITKPEDVTVDREELINGLKKNKYITYLGLYRGDDYPEIGIPVNVDFIFDQEEPFNATLKVTGNSKFLTALGVIKTPLEFEDEVITYTPTSGENKTLTYSKMNPNKFFFNLGTSRIPKYNYVSLILYFIKKQ